MNRIRRLRYHLACLPRPTGPLAAFAAVAPARSRWPDPPFPPGWKLPPGWNSYLLPPPESTKHPPLLGHVAGPVHKVSPRIPAHTAGAVGMPVWQIILIAAAAVLLTAALAVLIHRLRQRGALNPFADSRLKRGRTRPGTDAKATRKGPSYVHPLPAHEDPPGRTAADCSPRPPHPPRPGEAAPRSRTSLVTPGIKDLLG